MSALLLFLPEEYLNSSAFFKDNYYKFKLKEKSFGYFFALVCLIFLSFSGII